MDKLIPLTKRVEWAKNPPLGTSYEFIKTCLKSEKQMPALIKYLIKEFGRFKNVPKSQFITKEEMLYEATVINIQEGKKTDGTRITPYTICRFLKYMPKFIEQVGMFYETVDRLEYDKKEE